MKFGPIPLSQAEGAILAHSVGLPSGRLRKGQLLDRGHLDQMASAGFAEVIVASPDPGDILENDAALRLAQALVPDPQAVHLTLSHAFTGRMNVTAAGPGVVVLDPDRIARLNAIDPMLTLATVPQHQQMGQGGMVATVKVISYAVPEASVAAAEALLSGGSPLALHPPVLRRARLIVTEIPSGPGEKGVEAIRNRLSALNITLDQVIPVAHRQHAIRDALSTAGAQDLTLILTASATSDPYDVAPQALRDAGGHVERFGMPVDPGNLLFLGDLHGQPVIGLPGCVRSPALNGADWVLSRVACGVPVSGADIAGMGVGGLLKEIPTRPQPRSGRRT
ncbi:molybdopterin-binding protein [Pseudooceanicola nitratireducens]|uniref:molybdopterin-binding protein n=1 Tax=Pseudooceanicola nitratireducens TaxID=517719 RepID=UPI001C958298|nr:molybdopterin-binding protein [Pseudooceanicola nitratireducens]MBY6156789.1 molybdopterin-binding protein [Pseudooceanicola nitratireducens]